MTNAGMLDITRKMRGVHYFRHHLIFSSSLQSGFFLDNMSLRYLFRYLTQQYDPFHRVHQHLILYYLRKILIQSQVTLEKQGFQPIIVFHRVASLLKVSREMVHSLLLIKVFLGENEEMEHMLWVKVRRLMHQEDIQGKLMHP